MVSTGVVSLWVVFLLPLACLSIRNFPIVNVAACPLGNANAACAANGATPTLGRMLCGSVQELNNGLPEYSAGVYFLTGVSTILGPPANGQVAYIGKAQPGTRGGAGVAFDTHTHYGVKGRVATSAIERGLVGNYACVILTAMYTDNGAIPAEGNYDQLADMLESYMLIGFQSLLNSYDHLGLTPPAAANYLVNYRLGGPPYIQASVTVAAIRILNNWNALTTSISTGTIA
jgi:hypothetical protein